MLVSLSKKVLLDPSDYGRTELNFCQPPFTPELYLLVRCKPNLLSRAITVAECGDPRMSPSIKDIGSEAMYKSRDVA